jgi:hypothetical protein
VDNLEEKLNSVLNNPQMMQQIMTMAQSLGQAPQAPPEEHSIPVNTSIPGIDIATLQKISGLLQNSVIDGNEQALLSALTPYLSHEKVSRLERAMRAARMAKQVSSILGTNSLSLLTGR